MTWKISTIGFADPNVLPTISCYTYCSYRSLLGNFCAGKTVFTSDHALKLESVPDWIAIVGSGYIGLEFSDVYTALGSEVHESSCCE
jgi:hypothetical protein